jgi:Family of unknown function (DUF5519)
MTQQTITASEQITDAVMAWPEVTSGYGSRGEFAYKVSGREIGHLHGDHAAHFFFAHGDWSTLFAEGRITHHPVFPDKQGPAARRIAGEDDVRDVIAMMRLSYDRVVASLATRGRGPAAITEAASSPD